MPTCHACATDVSAQQRFCPECGEVIEANAPPAAEPAVPTGVPYTPQPDPYIGKVVADRFELKNVVGSDHDSRFFTAIDKETAETLTIRIVFYEEFSPKSELIGRLEAQHSRNRKLDHPAITRMRDILVEPEFAAIILDPSGQSTLDTYLKPPSAYHLSYETLERRRFPVSNRLLKDLLVQIFDGTFAMHTCHQVNGYLTPEHILVGEHANLPGPQVKLCAFGTRKGSASHLPDRFHYDDDRLTPIADVWYLGKLVRYVFWPLFAPFKEELAPILKQACLESRTNRIQTIAKLREGLAPIFKTEWSDEPLEGFDDSQ